MAELWVHSDSNKNIGVFAMFLGGVVAWPVPALLVALDRAPSALWHWHLFGVVLLGLGLLLFHFTRKRFRIRAGSLTVRDGLLSSPLHYRWEGPADIHLSSLDTDYGESWVVDLVCGKLFYRIHRSFDHLSENLSLAVSLARAIGGSLVEISDSQPVVIPLEELGLPYRERVLRHPQLLPRKVEKPALSDVTLIESEGQQSFCWRLSWPHLVSELTLDGRFYRRFAQIERPFPQSLINRGFAPSQPGRH